MTQIEQDVKPHEYGRVDQRGAEKDDKPRQRLRHDELRPDDAGQKPDDGFRQPADADDAARERILDEARERPASSPVPDPDVSAT